MNDHFDVIVVGAGHAGCEAAYAAARIGVRVAVCTLSTDTVAHMPCNPAIGGTAKGHLVREIDALGGLMGRAIDATGIQFKLLNRSRGPAVWSPRAQADKRVYSTWVKHALDAHKVVVILFWNRRAVDDRSVKRSLDSLPHRKAVAVFTDSVRHLSRYTRITAAASVTSTPALVVVSRKGQAEVINGYLDRQTVGQYVLNALRR